MTLPYGLTRAGAVKMVLEKLNSNVSHSDLRPVARYTTRMIFQSVNETFGNAMEIRTWLSGYNTFLAKLGRCYKITLNKILHLSRTFQFLSKTSGFDEIFNF